MKGLHTWRQLINEVVEENKDTLVASTLTDVEADIEFYVSWGGSEGIPFTAWGEKYVYFPVVYDGMEWVGSAPRHPSDEVTRHHGGQ